MRNTLALVAIALAGAANGVNTDSGVAVWRGAAYVALALLAYLHGRYLPARHGPLVLWGTALACLGLSAVFEFWESVGALLSLSLAITLPWLSGRSRYQQAELVKAGHRQVRQLEREQEFVAERARAEERARIATDMHDSLGHELALIALRAGALELAPDMTQSNRDAAEQLRTSAVTATDRLRSTIGMLRSSASVPVVPPDEPVATVVERAAAAGMAVTLTQPEPPPALPQQLDRAVHRLVQEALTNAARHAPGAAAKVHIAHQAQALTVSVVNGPATGPAMGAGNGSGLLGLRERVRLVGGQFHAGPTTDGFELRAVLPLMKGNS